METVNTAGLSQELFSLLKKTSRLKLTGENNRGLKPSECELLGVLYLNLMSGTKLMPASTLSQQLNITPAGVTHRLNALQDTGYIKREKSADDRRYVLVGLTQKGKKQADIVLKNTYHNLDQLIDLWGEDDSQVFIRLMSALIDFYSNVPKPA
ncbi:MAG: MarR family transcriptional regulator [Chloroflexi bacterium]|nr:MarR family transcriptional regulator [Chloroflexota bacterium]